MEKSSLPNHIGIIVDGNRRWAAENGKRTSAGHSRGADVLKDITNKLFDRGVNFVSAYIFSTENWKRKASEVDYLMRLFVKLLNTYLVEVGSNNVKIKVLGSRDSLDQKIIDVIEKAESATENNTGGTVAFCFNYGGQEEIVSATKKLISSGIDADSVNTEMIYKNIYGPDIPDIDLLIRTSGEQRLSGFMMWRAMYAELAFVDKNWPDVTIADFDKVLLDYKNRQRRFGC